MGSNPVAVTKTKVPGKVGSSDYNDHKTMQTIFGGHKLRLSDKLNLPIRMKIFDTTKIVKQFI